jgi:phosphohistidine phosphatase
MARQLWLLRHADAEPHGTRPDPQRYLTERGERQARLAGLALARMGMEFERVLSSPKERALRTATLALRAWGERSQDAPPQGGLEVHPPLEGGFDVRQALAVMARVGPDARVLAVGHEPDFSDVVEELTGACIDLKKAGLAVVRLASAPGADDASGTSVVAAGELILLLRPVELALIADVALAEA